MLPSPRTVEKVPTEACFVHAGCRPPRGQKLASPTDPQVPSGCCQLMSLGLASPTAGVLGLEGTESEESKCLVQPWPLRLKRCAEGREAADSPPRLLGRSLGLPGSEGVFTQVVMSTHTGAGVQCTCTCMLTNLVCTQVHQAHTCRPDIHTHRCAHEYAQHIHANPTYTHTLVCA